jgi:hypothetical protein
MELEQMQAHYQTYVAGAMAGIANLIQVSGKHFSASNVSLFKITAHK